MSTGAQAGQPGGVKYKASLGWAGYADLLKAATEQQGGVYKPFDQKKLMTAWANLSAMSDVKKGVCRALAASYLCRQYASSLVRNDDGSVDETAIQALAKEDPQLLESSAGQFFRVFREGRISADEVQTLRTGAKVQREKRPQKESGMVPQGVSMKGYLVAKKDGRWAQVNANGVAARKLGEPWRVRRVEQVAEAHYEAKRSRPEVQPGGMAEVYQGDMDRTMAYFSENLIGSRNGEIRLAGPYTDWIWEMEGATQGYFMCWVSDHALALAVKAKAVEGKGNYKVKFFDPNFGECKFKTLAEFKEFAKQIAYGFGLTYHQRHMDYRMFSC